MNIRQTLFSAARYENFIREYDELLNLFSTNKFKSDSALEEASQRARYFQTLALEKLFATYTAGERIEKLIPMLEELIEKYEIRQKTLAEYLGVPNISPLAIDDWPHQYEEAVQVISLCILLHRTDLLLRFVKLIDDAGYGGEDTLYEALLNKVVPHRHDIDDWYHDVYTLLIQAIYSDNKGEPPKLLKKYCQQWYRAFKQAPGTIPSSRRGRNLRRYWALKQALLPFCMALTTAKSINGLPQDLVEYARNLQPN